MQTVGRSARDLLCKKNDTLAVWSKKKKMMTVSRARHELKQKLVGLWKKLYDLTTLNSKRKERSEEDPYFFLSSFRARSRL